MKGYGNYEELTSSGIDPKELFDDVQDIERLPDLITPVVVIEDCNDVVEEASQNDVASSDNMHLLPIDRARKRVGLRNSESNCSPTFNPTLDGVSISTTPSMFSLISMPNESEGNMRINVVTVFIHLI